MKVVRYAHVVFVCYALAIYAPKVPISQLCCHQRTIGANFASSACSKELLFVLNIICCNGFFDVGGQLDMYRCSFYNFYATLWVL